MIIESNNNIVFKRVFYTGNAYDFLEYGKIYDVFKFGAQHNYFIIEIDKIERAVYINEFAEVEDYRNDKINKVLYD